MKAGRIKKESQRDQTRKRRGDFVCYVYVRAKLFHQRRAVLVWNSSPKERSHKLTHFCFFKHQLASPQGLGAVPFPNHFGTVKHKSWGVEAVEAESYDLGTRCKLLRVSARFFFFSFFTTRIFFLIISFLVPFMSSFLPFSYSLPRCLFYDFYLFIF